MFSTESAKVRVSRDMPVEVSLDLNSDGVLDSQDLGLLLSRWGEFGSEDLSIVLAQWGTMWGRSENGWWYLVPATLGPYRIQNDPNQGWLTLAWGPFDRLRYIEDEGTPEDGVYSHTYELVPMYQSRVFWDATSEGVTLQAVVQPPEVASPAETPGPGIAGPVAVTVAVLGASTLLRRRWHGKAA